MKISAKLSVWFLLITLGSLIFFGYVSYSSFKKTIIEEKKKGLAAIAKNKIRYIEGFFYEKENDVSVLAHTASIIDAMQNISEVYGKFGMDSPEYTALYEDLAPFLAYYKDTFGFYDIFLISYEGDLVFTTEKELDFSTNVKTGLYKNTQLGKVFNRASTLMETEISDFEYFAPIHSPAAFVAAPIIKAGRIIGVLVFQLVADEIYSLVQDYSGLGKTGETVVASKVGNQVIFTAPSRHDPDAAFRRRIDIGSDEAQPIKIAVEGNRGMMLAVDYRGENVLAVYEYLPQLSWGIVVKVDVSEAFSPVYKLRKWQLIIGGVIIFTVTFVVFPISRSMSRPISILKKETAVIGAGNLDHRVGTRAKDELGDLSRAFDKMTESLQKVTASRDDLEKIKIELERSNQDLEQFAYVASHDLQEPLRSVTGFLQLLDRRYSDRLDSDAKEFIERSVAGAFRMRDLIQSLLAYSRIQTRGRPFEIADCGSILVKALDNLQAAIEQNGARITHDPMPTVEVDGFQFVQLFQNLIENALKYRGEDPPRIHIGVEQKPDRWIFSVKDNGIGIDPGYSERIFQIFQRLHSRSDYSGTGIGLSICKKIMERHGGKIWVESEPGEGAAFFFVLHK